MYYATVGLLPRTKFYVYLGRNVEMQPQNCQNLVGILRTDLPLQGRLVCTIFTKFLAFLRVYR